MLIGSQAARLWYYDFPRDPADTDEFTPISRDGVETFWHESFPDSWRFRFAAHPSFLYTLKVSHAFWDLHGTWNKHMSDVIFFQSKGAEFDREIYDILFPVWKEKHGRKKTNLFQSKSQFFSDAVTRIYDHDSIHASIAYGDHPLYEDVLLDGAEVATGWDKFLALSDQHKLQLCREEVYATALERWVIPSNYTFSPRHAYALAMKKTITSLFKNEWALFLVLNYSELRRPDVDYVQVHRDNASKLILF